MGFKFLARSQKKNSGNKNLFEDSKKNLETPQERWAGIFLIEHSKSASIPQSDGQTPQGLIPLNG